MITVEFPEQSSAADWIESIQVLAEDDGAPVWSSVPGDLVVTMTVIPEGVSSIRDYGANPASATSAVIVATTTDGTGRLTAFPEGFVEISIDDSVMLTIGPDRFGVSKRYLVYFRIQTGGYTMQFLAGVLPVYLGA